jgi:hypothetical protein
MAGEANRQIVERFWQTMNTNDWGAVGQLLHDHYVLDWPQSGERIRGPANFAAINAHYPVSGPWRFAVQRLVADDLGAAADVLVSAPSLAARVVSFFEVRDGLIWRMTEFWPDPFPPEAWRAPWVEPLASAPEELS